MVKWKNIDFSAKGIVVEKTPTISKGKKNIETYTIDGRNGFLSIDRGTYQPFSLSVECHAKETANFDEIKAFLDGYGTLTFDGQREYTAIVNNAIPFEKVQMFKSFVVQFMVNPISHDITASTINLISGLDDGEFTITGSTYDIEPTLTIACEGDVGITINNKTFTLDDANGTYILDCANKVITKNGINASNIMSGDFPTFKNGTNVVSTTGTITAFSASYKKAYI